MVPVGGVRGDSRVRLCVDLDPGGVPLNASLTTFADGDVLGIHVYKPEPFDSFDDIAGYFMAWLDEHGIQMRLFT